MPKDTFFNLPGEKRSLICQVAIDEFAAYPFEQASINRIVARSGIAKGSFYQYFEDKKDLYFYIIQLATDEKLKYLAPLVQNPDRYDFFDLMREMYRAGIQFSDDHPKYAQISKKLLEQKDSPIYQELMADTMPSAYRLFEDLLKDAIAKREVRADIDVPMFAYLITSMSTLVIEYYTEYVANEYNEKLFETIDKFIDFLKHGIGSENSTEQ